MIAMPNSHLALHKEALKQHFEKKASIEHSIQIINLGAINCPLGRKGLIPKANKWFSSMLTIVCFGNLWVNEVSVSFSYNDRTLKI